MLQDETDCKMALRKQLQPDRNIAILTKSHIEFSDISENGSCNMLNDIQRDHKSIRLRLS
jgi:hypothetical protein